MRDERIPYYYYYYCCCWRFGIDTPPLFAFLDLATTKPIAHEHPLDSGISAQSE